jgi:hypothetical protein
MAPWSSRFPHLHTKAPTTHFSVAVPATLDYAAAVALHLIHYNFARIHNFLRFTPAMAACLSDHVWSYEEIAGLAS